MKTDQKPCVWNTQSDTGHFVITHKPALALQENISSILPSRHSTSITSTPSLPQPLELRMLSFPAFKARRLLREIKTSPCCLPQWWELKINRSQAPDLQNLKLGGRCAQKQFCFFSSLSGSSAAKSGMGTTI